MNDTNQQPGQQVIARRQPTNFEISLAAYEPQLQAALPAHISLERFKRVVITAINQNPDLLKADTRSLFLSCVRAAQDGLFPDGREAALVVFGGKVQYLPMVAGIIKRMRNSGDVASVDTQIVHERDEFRYQLGDQAGIHHIPTLGEGGKAICAYAIIKLTNGEILREVMSTAQIEKVRSVSRAGRNGPWVEWWEEMARKSVLRRCAKRAPVSSDLDEMLRREDEEDLRQIGEGDRVVTIPPRPQRADFRSGPSTPREEPAAEQPAARADVDDEAGWEVIVIDGVIKRTTDPEEATSFLLEAISEAAARSEESLEAIWEDNARFVSALREAGLGESADALNRAYGGSIDELRRQRAEAQRKAHEKRQTKAEAPAPEPAPKTAAEAQGGPQDQGVAPRTEAVSQAQPPAPAPAPEPSRRKPNPPGRSPLATRRPTDWPAWTESLCRYIGSVDKADVPGIPVTYAAEIEFCRDNRGFNYDRVMEALDLRRQD